MSVLALCLSWTRLEPGQTLFLISQLTPRTDTDIDRDDALKWLICLLTFFSLPLCFCWWRYVKLPFVYLSFYIRCLSLYLSKCLLYVCFSLHSRINLSLGTASLSRSVPRSACLLLLLLEMNVVTKIFLWLTAYSTAYTVNHWNDRAAFFAWRAPILSWPRIMCSQVRMLKFLEPSREMP